MGKLRPVLARLDGDLTLPFFAYFGFFLLYALLPLLLGDEIPESGEIIGGFIGWLGFSWWLMEDARRMRFILPMAYGIMALMCPLIFVPLYLFQTRGVMAFVTMTLFVLTLVFVVAISVVVHIQ